ncbi:MAG: ribonuclease J [Actinomycetaceae bacterium]|nr:ribonuclease J [Actinomycetaceae bacterium]
MSALYPDLPEPLPLQEHGIRVTPLGGLGDVGRNMTVVEDSNGHMLLIDCGLLFPEEIQPGVDVILPDFSYIAERIDKVVALILTHGHEDHIGAVPYLLKLRPDIPLYGSQLTMAFLEAKFKEHRLENVHINVVAEDDVIAIEPFECEFVAVNHSIPDALAVMVRTQAGNILFTGDFKMDQLPLDGRLTDLRAFGRLGEEGVDLFCVDSTNAEVPGFVAHERDIGPVLNDVFRRATGQIIVASFASHVHRVQQVLDAAKDSGRYVAFIGRSMERNMRIAADKGFLHIPDNLLVDSKDLHALPLEERVYMATGSQGEPMAALSRIAHDSHRFVELNQGDTVVLASSLIPGNENSVSRVINELMKRGANVVHKGNSKVHVSGHAAAGELLYTYNIVQPRNVLPIHGEIRHLVANGKLAIQTGVPASNVVIAEDGVSVDLVDGEAYVAGQTPCNYIYVDGQSIGEISEEELKDRMTLSNEGFVSVFATVDTAAKTIIAGPHVAARGMAENDTVFREVLPSITKALDDALTRGETDTYALQQAIRRVIGRWVSRKLRRRPMIVPVVVEVSAK